MTGPALQSGVSPRTANYDIDVTLDPSTRTLTGSELITWHNQGTVPAYSIRLHLYWNAFRNTNSTWLKQRHMAGDDPFAGAAADDFGYTDVTKITIVNADGSDGVDLTKDLRFISPDDQNADDRIAGSGDAGQRDPAGPDAAAARQLEGPFPEELRSHRRDRQLLLRLAVVSRSWACSTRGWTAHQFFANSEFFADFGSYDVRMTVPKGWTVGATGVEQSRSRQRTPRPRIATRRTTCTTSRGRRARTSSRSGSSSRCRAARRCRCGC